MAVVIIYSAGAPGPRAAEDDMAKAGLLSARLVTYADPGQVARGLSLVATYPHIRLFVDSGAFSVFTGRATVDLGEYCEFLAEHQARLFAYAALDVIGDWRAGLSNCHEMLRRGLSPVPCFHAGEPWDVLDTLLSEGHSYIALGGLIGNASRGLQHTQERLGPYLDRAFRAIGRVWPKRVHLFGLCSPWILERYPAFSTDSTSARRGAGMGVVQEQCATGDWRWSHYRALAAETLNGSVADGISARPEMGRWKYNLRAQGRIARHATDLWTARGVTWH